MKELVIEIEPCEERQENISSKLYSAQWLWLEFTTNSHFSISHHLKDGAEPTQIVNVIAQDFWCLDLQKTYSLRKHFPLGTVNISPFFQILWQKKSHIWASWRLLAMRLKQALTENYSWHPNQTFLMEKCMQLEGIGRWWWWWWWWFRQWWWWPEWLQLNRYFEPRVFFESILYDLFLWLTDSTKHSQDKCKCDSITLEN